MNSKRELYRYRLNTWNLLFENIDRYFEIVLSNFLEDTTRPSADFDAWYSTAYRNLGFTAHPNYLEVAELMGFIGVWEQRGPLDFCNKVEDRWVCN